MRHLKAFFSSVPKYLLWAVLSTLFWLWIFTILNDAPAEKKVTLYADVPVLADPGLSVCLEQDLPEGIRMVRAHSFSYVMFGDAALTGADIFIVKGSDAERYRESFAPLPEAFAKRYPDALSVNGSPSGIRVFDAETGTGAACSYITYAEPGTAAEDYYLFFGAESLHCGRQDTAAYRIAELFLQLP